MQDDVQSAKELKSHGLRYVDCNKNGIKRLRKGKRFTYVDKKGKTIKDDDKLKRIASLVIPPAWEDVWICSSPNGHIQATGIDVRGRKQYKYHTAWSSLRKDNKFANLIVFGKGLPLLRKQIKRDLRRKDLDERKVVALALEIMDQTSIRIGNEQYSKQNGSYGLTTLKNKHADFQSNKVLFEFVGKKGIKQRKVLKGKRLYNILRSVKEIPGQRLFQYLDKNGRSHTLDSNQVNHYLKTFYQEEVTCKTFRTWNACFSFLGYLSETTRPETKKERKETLNNTIERVAKLLGNTKTIAKNHYIDPRLIESYEEGLLDSWLKKVPSGAKEREKHITKKLLRMLHEANK